MSQLSPLYRALTLASRARGKTAPNPPVGCVITRDGQVLGEGYHHRCGAPHAEVEAVRVALRAGHTLAGATAWVTLEPCNHHGRTPPCSELLARHGITRVVFGAHDDVSGSAGGAAWLRAQGIAAAQTDDQRLRADCDELIRFWRHNQRMQHPYFIGKLAVCRRGRINAATGLQTPITGTAAQQHTHELRRECDALLVGVGTVLADDPQLTCRSSRRHDPLRVIIDPRGRLLRGHWRALADDNFLIITRNVALRRRFGAVRVVLLPRVVGGIDPREIAQILWQRGMCSVLVEGGARTISEFLQVGLIDEFHSLQNLRIRLRGQKGLQWGLRTSLQKTQARRLGNDYLQVWRRLAPL